MNIKKLALSRIKELFEQAEIEPKYSTRYVEIARKIAMKAQISMPKEYRMRYCHNCYTYFNSKTLKSRLSKGNKELKCQNCGNTDLYPVK